MTVIRRFALLITWVGCASPDPVWKMDRGEADVSEERKIAACAAALDAVSPEAEKSYRAALSAPTRGKTRAVESAFARRALTELELTLAQAPSASSLDRSAREFASAAEALLLRAREPARCSADGAWSRADRCKRSWPPTTSFSMPPFICTPRYRRWFVPVASSRRCEAREGRHLSVEWLKKVENRL